MKRAEFSNQLRDGWVEVNLGQLEENILDLKNQIRNNSPKNLPKLMAVIKADGYGHGSIALAPTLLACGINAFGVATLDEGIELRKNKITAPILVLGAVPQWGFENALLNNIQISIFNNSHLEVAKQVYEKTGKKLMVQVKIDTGMNRIGVPLENAKSFINNVKSLPCFNLKGIFTHFADVENEEIFNSQVKGFKNLLSSIDTKGLTIHCSNSSASLIKGDLNFDMVRLGIAMYGLTPFSQGFKNNSVDKLKQIISLKGRITNVHTLKKGDGVSYGHYFVAQKETKIATIPIGYADGVSRNLSGKILGGLEGKVIKQIGRITMDQMMFDLGENEAKIGDIITLLGTDGENYFPIDSWAEKLNTINYELTCRLKVRLPRVYTR